MPDALPGGEISVGMQGGLKENLLTVLHASTLSCWFAILLTSWILCL